MKKLTFFAALLLLSVITQAQTVRVAAAGDLKYLMPEIIKSVTLKQEPGSRTNSKSPATAFFPK